MVCVLLLHNTVCVLQYSCVSEVGHEHLILKSYLTLSSGMKELIKGKLQNAE